MDLPKEPPGRGEIEAHFNTFERCHSLARAEKDLLVRRVLLAMERFRSDRARLAIEGGTALVAYHRATTRFSEDLGIRLIPDASVRRLDTDERIALLKEIGQEFKAHVHAQMPFLEPTRKGRIRKDAVLQTFIYNYRSAVPDENVVAGIKCELVHVPLMMPTVERVGVTGEPFDAIRVPEIASGKWQALATPAAAQRRLLSRSRAPRPRPCGGRQRPGRARPGYRPPHHAARRNDARVRGGRSGRARPAGLASTLRKLYGTDGRPAGERLAEHPSIVAHRTRELHGPGARTRPVAVARPGNVSAFGPTICVSRHRKDPLGEVAFEPLSGVSTDRQLQRVRGPQPNGGAHKGRLMACGIKLALGGQPATVVRTTYSPSA